jgi:pantothenate kinase
VILGIAGPPGSGKSTLAERILIDLRAEHVPVAHLPMDGFHLADVTLDALGRRSRKGAADTFDAAGYIAMLQRLRSRNDAVVYAPGFERELEQPIAAAIAIPRDAELVVTEGNYLLFDGDWAGARPLLDACWYVSVDDDLRRSRLVERHVRFGKTADDARAWVESVDEPNARLITATRDGADALIRVD